MTTESNYQDFFDQMAAIEEAAANQLSSQLITNPQLAEELNKQLQALYAAVVAADDLAPVPPDLGVAQLAGIGPDAAATLGDTRITYGVMPYDETVNKVLKSWHHFEMPELDLEMVFCSYGFLVQSQIRVLFSHSFTQPKTSILVSKF